MPRLKVGITRIVGKQIQEARKEKGLTQKEMGERLGISESAVNRYEGGSQNLTLQTLQNVATALKTSFTITINGE